MKKLSIEQKIEMLGNAMSVLNDAIKQNYYNSNDLIELNYSEITEWLGWPDFQDGGVYEQIIELASEAILLLKFGIER